MFFRLPGRMCLDHDRRNTIGQQGAHGLASLKPRNSNRARKGGRGNKVFRISFDRGGTGRSELSGGGLSGLEVPESPAGCVHGEKWGLCSVVLLGVYRVSAVSLVRLVQRDRLF